MTETGCTECGHNMSAHEDQSRNAVGKTGIVAARVTTFNVCTVDGCYCGRDPLAGAHRETCGWCSTADPIVWCITAASLRSGTVKRIPIEPEPNPAGNVEIRSSGTGGAPVAVVHKSPPGMFDDWTPYMPHHARCDMKLRPDYQPKAKTQ